MTKLTKDEIKEIDVLHKQGIKPTKIAKKFNIVYKTVRYWTDEQYRIGELKRLRSFNAKLYKEGKAWGQRNPKKRRIYMAKYIMKRYHTEPEFRKRCIQSMIRYNKKRKLRDELNAKQALQ